MNRQLEELLGAALEVQTLQNPVDPAAVPAHPKMSRMDVLREASNDLVMIAETMREVDGPAESWLHTVKAIQTALESVERPPVDAIKLLGTLIAFQSTYPLSLIYDTLHEVAALIDDTVWGSLE